MHSMQLLLKIAWAAGCSSAATETSSCADGVKALWGALRGLCLQFKEDDQAALDDTASLSTSDAVTYKTEFFEVDKYLALMLALQVLHLLPSAIGRAGEPADTFCFLLSALMVKSRRSVYQAVAKLIIEHGECRCLSQQYCEFMLHLALIQANLEAIVQK